MRNWSCFPILVLVLTARAHSEEFVVTSIEDSGPGTLRQAILDATGFPGDDLITFNVPNGSEIAPLTPLPELRSGAIVDALELRGSNNVVLSGSQLGASGVGLLLSGENTVVNNLFIVEFEDAGVVISGSGNRVSGCFIGNEGGDTVRGNGVGIRIEGDDNTVGFDPVSEDERNIISGNTSHGVLLTEDADNNTIAGNIIGLNENGDTIVSNGGSGIRDLGDGTRIGLPEQGRRNFISGNAFHGIHLGDEGAPANGTEILNNIIGLTDDQTDTRPNQRDGIFGYGAGVRIGDVDAGNTIAGNLQSGIELWCEGSEFCPIQGNLIGVRSTGNQDLGNGVYGIHARSAGPVFVGGSTTGTGNTVSGNDLGGIRIETDDSFVLGNVVGLSADQTTSVPNDGVGINVQGSNVWVGGPDAGDGNSVESNARSGILVSSDSTRVFVRRNQWSDNAFGNLDVQFGGNANLDNPLILGTYPVRGTADPGAILDFYIEETDGSDTVFVGTGIACEDGTFEFDIDLTAESGRAITCTQTTPLGTSDLYPRRAIPNPQAGDPATDCPNPVQDIHSADTDQDGSFSLSETLRVLQLFNSADGFQCDDGTLDGYALGDQDRTCIGHYSDYSPFDWRIGLSELLRAIQIFQSGGYDLRISPNSEDGFQPAA